MSEQKPGYSERPNEHEPQIANQFEGVVESRADQPTLVEAKNGKMAFGTDEGALQESDDAMVVSTGRNAFVVIDGLGGLAKTGHVVDIFKKEALDLLGSGDHLDNLQDKVYKSIKANGIEYGGACYLAAELKGTKLEISHAGDVKLIVIDSNGGIKFETEEQRERPAFPGAKPMPNAVTGFNRGRLTKREAKIDVGDRIIAASDGIWDNMKPEDIARLIGWEERKDIMTVVQIMNRVRGAMRMGSKPDNISLFVYDIERLENEA